MEKIIECSSKENAKKVASFLKKDGYKWRNNIEMPNFKYDKLAIYLLKDKQLVYSDLYSMFYYKQILRCEPISDEDYLKTKEEAELGFVTIYYDNKTESIVAFDKTKNKRTSVKISGNKDYENAAMEALMALKGFDPASEPYFFVRYGNAFEFDRIMTFACDHGYRWRDGSLPFDVSYSEIEDGIYISFRDGDTMAYGRRYPNNIPKEVSLTELEY